MATGTLQVTPYQLTPEQRANAAIIVQEGMGLQATTDEILGALSAGISESHLMNLNYGDRDSLGVFQQREAGYGGPSLRTNVRTAARAFLTRLIGTRSSNAPIGTRVANVQRPAAQYRGMYAANLDEALSVYQQVTGDNDANLPPPDFGTVPVSSTTPAPTETVVSQVGILKSLDATLNVKGGIIDQLNPINDLRVILARGAVVLGGVIVGTFGLILLTGSIAKTSGLTGVAKAAPGPVGTAAVAADAVDGE